MVNYINKRRNKAFSFVEVVVAAVVVNIAVMGCFGAFFYAKAKVQATKRQLMALNYAQAEMERLLSLRNSDSDLDSTTTHLTNTLPTGTGAASELRDTWSGTRTYTITMGPNDYGASQRYKIITVTVDWTEPSI
jgi:Tfp pilus assembly protein PilV